MSNVNKRTRKAFEMGYLVREDGSVKGIRVTTRACSKSSQGYLCFGFTGSAPVMVHKLAAYQKFGEEAFAEGIQVRHLNDNRLDNRLCNIAIGTQAENFQDTSSEKFDNDRHGAMSAKKHSSRSFKYWERRGRRS